jgi:hypothetical protein
VELETGGNIRFQEGNGAEKWYTSCIDLIDSRFKSDEFEPYNIENIKIKRIQRIHNRFLRVKFEERLSKFSDSTTGNPNK